MPRVGDTLVIRMDQSALVSGSRFVARDAGDGGSRTEMQVYSHVVVLGRDASGTILDAVTDSVALRSSDDRARVANARTQQQLRGQRVRMRIAPDGGTTILTGENRSARALADAAALIPATFPTEPIVPGQHWTREMTIPVGATAMRMSMGGLLRADFSLDSTSRGGQLAFVSVHGVFRPTEATAHTASGALENGSVSGSLVIDRVRGWLAESQVTVIAQSFMPPLAGLAGSGMTLQIVIQQRTRLVDRK